MPKCPLRSLPGGRDPAHVFGPGADCGSFWPSAWPAAHRPASVSPAASVTNDHTRGGCQQHTFSVLEPGSPTPVSMDGMKSRCPPGPAPSGGLGGMLPHLFWLLVAAGAPWFLGLWPHHPDPCLHGRMATPLYVNPPSASLLCRRTRLHSGSTRVIPGHHPISRS